MLIKEIVEVYHSTHAIGLTQARSRLGFARYHQSHARRARIFVHLASDARGRKRDSNRQGHVVDPETCQPYQLLEPYDLPFVASFRLFSLVAPAEGRSCGM